LATTGPTSKRVDKEAVIPTAVNIKAHVASGDHVTDISGPGTSLPGRLGVAARFEDGHLILELRPQKEVLHHGIVRASVLSFVIDVVAGIPLDQDADVWTLTSDMSVRMRPIPAPERIDATSAILRQGRRSATCLVELRTDEGAPIATGAIGFTKIPRKTTDPPKPNVPLGQTPLIFRDAAALVRPLREEAGIQVIDAAEGIVQVEVTPDLRNPAGTLQGAMVALLAEAAAEDLVATRFESPFVVTDLDLQYLRKAQRGPVRTRSRLLGSGPDAPIQIELVDTSTGEITTLVYAAVVPVS
jgi:acyl-coenzyme A thioesterase PaaI-like protein